MQQLALSIEFEKLIPIREEIPDYIKFYPIYQYDRNKFKILLNEEKRKNPPKTINELKKIQNEILKKCYIRDDTGNPVKLSDEPHIFRYAVLYKIYAAIYKELGYSAFDKITQANSGGLVIFRERYKNEYYDYNGQKFKGQNFIMYGACINGSETFPLKDRIKIHINFLKMYRILIFLIAFKRTIING